MGTLTAITSETIIGTIPNTVVLGNGYLTRVILSMPSIANSPIRTTDVTALRQCLLNAYMSKGN